MSDHHASRAKHKTAVAPQPKDHNVTKQAASKTMIPMALPVLSIEENIQTAERLLKSEKVLEGINEYEQAMLKLHSELPRNEFEPKFVEIIKKIAMVAIGMLNNGKKELCFGLLGRLERLLQDGLYGSFNDLKSLVFNHLGCYYRRIEKPEVAIEYYQNALEIVEAQEKKVNSGLTHMNLSAIYSQTQKHEKALRHAKLAVNESQFEIMEMLKQGKEYEQLKNSEDFKTLVSILAISYHNLGNEEELMSNMEDARDCFQKSLKIIQEHFGNFHNLYPKFKKHLDEFQKRFLHKKVLSETLNQEPFQTPNRSSNLKPKKNIRPSSANLAGHPPPPNISIGKSKKKRKKMDSSIKFDKFKPYFQAYQLNPQAVFFIGSQIFLKNPNLPSKPVNLAYKSFKSSKGIKMDKSFFKKAQKAMEENKSHAEDIVSLEHKGVLTWESQISDDLSDQETNTRRAEFLQTLTSLNKPEKNSPGIPTHSPQLRKLSTMSHATPGGILRRKEEKERNNMTEISEKILSFEINSVEKTPKSNKFKGNSPNKAKSKSISFSKQGTSPLKKRKQTNEDLIRFARRIQKNFREFLGRKTEIYRNFKIVQHFPSYTLPQFVKKGQVFEKKAIGGSLLIIYYRRTAHLRVVFKIVQLRRVSAHVFDFSDLQNEKLRISLFDEFLKKTLLMLCLFGDTLVFKSWAFSNQKSHKIKINKFIFEEIELLSVTESFTKLSVPLFNQQNTQTEGFEPLFTKEEPLVSLNSSLTSLRPLINDYDGEDFGIFPLINQVGSLSDFSMVEPLLNPNESDEPKAMLDITSENNAPKNVNTSIENDQIIQGKSSEQFLELKPIRNSIVSERRSTILSSIPSRNNLENIDKQMNPYQTAFIIIIQRRIRNFLARKQFLIEKQGNPKVIKKFLRRKGPHFAFISICKQKSSNQYFLVSIFKSSFAWKESNKFVDNSQETNQILARILTFSCPLVWIKVIHATSKVSLKDPLLLQKGLIKFENITAKIPLKLLSFGYQNIFLNCRLCQWQNNATLFQQCLDRIKTNIIRRNFKLIVFWSKSQDGIVNATKKIMLIFKNKKEKVWKQFNTKLRLIFELKTQLTSFCDKTSAWMDVIETKRGFLTSFKQIFLYSKFKDCDFLDRRMLYYKKKTIEIFCYFQPLKELLLIYTLSSEVMQYEEKIDFVLENKRHMMISCSSSPAFKGKKSLLRQETQSPSKNIINKKILNLEKVSNSMGELANGNNPDEEGSSKFGKEAKFGILQQKIRNITMMQDSNSIKLKFKLYPSEYLEATLTIQNFLYCKLYSRKLEFRDLKSGHSALCYFLLQSNKIYLLLKNQPSLMSTIYEISSETCYFLRMTQKISSMEEVLSQGISYSAEKNEILFKEPKIPKVWMRNTAVFEGVKKKALLVEIELKTRKLLFRIENEEKFYKITLPGVELEEENALEQIKDYIKKSIESTVILMEEDGKLRILNDEDPYGPLVFKEVIDNNPSLKVSRVIFRLVDIKKTFQVLIEVPQAYHMVTLITNFYVPYENEEHKKLVSEYISKGFKENLQFDSVKGVTFRKEFLKMELDDYLMKNKFIVESPKKIIRKNSPKDNETNEGKNKRKTSETSKIIKNQNFEPVSKSQSNKNSYQKPQEKVELEAEAEGSEKSALMIQKRHRSKAGGGTLISPPPQTKKEVFFSPDELSDYEKQSNTSQKQKYQKKKRHTQDGSQFENNEKKQNKDPKKRNSDNSNVKMEKNQERSEEVLISPDELPEYEKAANLIQQKYRNRKKGNENETQPNNAETKDKKDNNIPPLHIQTNESKIISAKLQSTTQNNNGLTSQKKEEKEEDVVILPEELPEYEKAANLIQQKYRKRKNNQQQMPQSQTKEHDKQNKSQPKTNNTESNSQKQQIKEEELVILPEELPEYEKAANLIQQKYRSRKNNQPISQPKSKSNNDKIQSKRPQDKLDKENFTKKQTEKLIEKEEVILEGDIAEYEAAALKIQEKYRKKKMKCDVISPETPKSKINRAKTHSKNKMEHEKNQEIEEVKLEGDIAEYEAAAVKIQAKYRKKKMKEEEISPKTPTNEKKGQDDSPPKPLLVQMGNDSEPKPMILEGELAEYESAALKIQAKYRMKHVSKGNNPRNPSENSVNSKDNKRSEESSSKNIRESNKTPENLTSSKKSMQDDKKAQSQPQSNQFSTNNATPNMQNLKKSITLEKTENIQLENHSSGQRLDGSMGNSHYSLPSKSSSNHEDFNFNKDGTQGSGRRHSFKNNNKRNSIFSKFKGRTFEQQKTTTLEEQENMIRDENYRIRVFPAPEDLEIAVCYIQEWWRGVLVVRERKWSKKEDEEMEGFLEDIGYFSRKNSN